MAKRKDFFSEGGDCCEVLDVVLIDTSEFSSDDTYSILMKNDDYTSQFFVLKVLMTVFDYDESGAVLMINKIEKQGASIVATYSSEKEAKSKEAEVNLLNALSDEDLQVEVIKD